MKEAALRALEPPTTRPRGTCAVRPGISSADRSQFAGWPEAAARIVAGAPDSGGKPPGSGWSAPASSSSTRRPASARRAATTQPDVPAPTTTTSHPSSIGQAEHPGEVEPAHLAGGGAWEVVEPVHRLGAFRGAEP